MVDTFIKVLSFSAFLASASVSSNSIESETNPFTITQDVLDALEAIEDANNGEVKEVCYKDA